MTATQAGATSSRESLADRVLLAAAMVGAVGGAFAGTVLGAETGTAFPLESGTLGTMLGSGIAAGAWCLLARLWTGPVRAARSEAVTPAPSAK